MLTGDKVETATCIAISAGFKDRRTPLFFMRDLTSTMDVEMKLSEFEKQTSSLLMIDGGTLDQILGKPHMEERFLVLAMQAPAVCVCRCSPTQKAIIT